MLKIIDRYIAKEFIKNVFLSIIVFSSLFLLVDLLQRSMKDGLTPALFKYSLLQVPYIVSQMVPMACLIGSLFTLSHLAKNSELIAMHACGISIERLSSMILIVALLFGIINFYVADAIVPPSLKQANYVLHVDVKKQKEYQIFKTNRIWYRSKNAIYNIDNFDVGQKTVHGIDIYLFDDSFNLIEQIVAEQAQFDGSNWTLFQGKSTTYIDNFPITHQFQSKTAEYILEKPEDLKEVGNLETMSYQELKGYIEKNKRAGFDTVRHEVNLYAKVAFIVACLIMAFIGIPFAAKNPRSGGMTLSFGTGLVIAFFYWLCLNAGLTFGYSRTLPPLISAWITNVVFAIAGFYLLKRQNKVGSVWPF